jgi:long-chain-fatty-acid---luciferin-component ligase
MTTEVLDHRILDAVSPVDRAVFGDAWALPDDPGTRLELVRASVAHHLAACPPYADYAARRGFSLDQLRTPAELHLVPQIPTAAFKRGVPILSCPPGEIAKRCTSSGTLGRRSDVYRDRTTIERLLGSVRQGMELIGELLDDEVGVLNLGPDQAEAGELWFAYVMSLVELVLPTEHAVRGGKFDPHEALGMLKSLRDQYSRVVLIGPPALVLEVANAAPQPYGPPAGAEELMVVTAGGWKRHTGAVLDRDEFTAAVLGGLGLACVDQVRDAFNQVELNTVLLECAHRRKHVPPWLEVIVREPRTLEPLGAGEPGLLSYVDPTATSYPCFLLADDLGVVDAGPCPCGWPGRTLRVIRRIQRKEEWGCALKMDQAYRTETP